MGEWCGAALRRGTTRVLITTDVWARGIDVQQVSLVINYDLPNNRENYIHRIGRSGRYGRKAGGIALESPPYSSPPPLSSQLESFCHRYVTVSSSFCRGKQPALYRFVTEATQLVVVLSAKPPNSQTHPAKSDQVRAVRQGRGDKLREGGRHPHPARHRAVLLDPD